MNESFNSDELSADDLAILQAFENMDLSDWEIGSSSRETAQQNASNFISEGNEMPADGHVGPSSSAVEMLSPEDMLALYIGEADEDMSTIRRALQQLEPDEHLEEARLQTIHRAAHKMKGTAGAIGYIAISMLAHLIEELTQLIINGTVIPFVGLTALVQTVRALEMTLNNVVIHNQEITAPLAELEAEYRALNIDIYNSSLRSSSFSRGEEENTAMRIPFKASEEDEGSVAGAVTKSLQEHPSAALFVRIDGRRFEQLVLHSEQLAELSVPLENAQAEVERAMQELHAAQTHLQHLEASLASHLLLKKSSSGQSSLDERPTSSLVARILDEAAQRIGRSYQRKNKSQYQPLLLSPSLLADEGLRWDDLEMDRFTESDVLTHSFGEAIADVVTASAQLRIAFAQLRRITQRHMAQATSVRNDASLLRLTPMSPLLTRIERAVVMSGIAQQRQIQFEVTGETTKIDQDILEELKQPLLQLVRTCVARELSSPEQERGKKDDRIWFFVRAVGNEITIEIGFSQPIGGGSLNEVQDTIRRLNGSITAQRNETGSISFYLRFPRSQGAVHGLLVRAGHQHVIVPFSQVQHIDDGQHSEQPPTLLNTLLGFPLTEAPSEGARPVLILQSDPYFQRLLAVEADEVLGTVELVVKPMAPHLRRPGIIGSAIDGMGNVLLMIDVHELSRHQQALQRRVEALAGNSPLSPEQAQPSVLVADDSVYIRQSLLHTLSHAGYSVSTAGDGMEALEMMLDHPSEVLVLDMEMPNLNGYDLISMMQMHRELANVKVVMLTSRSSEKHLARAHDLGAHAYLTKPCPQDKLLETLKQLLTH